MSGLPEVVWALFGQIEYLQFESCDSRSQLDGGGVKPWPAIKLWRIIPTVSCGRVTEVTAYPERCSNSIF